MIRIKQKMVLIGWVLAILVAAVPPAMAETFADYWEDLHPKLEELMDLFQKEQTAPDSSWVPFKEDKNTLRREIAELTDEAIEILNISNLSELKEELNQARNNAIEFEKRLSEVRTKSLMAPRDVAGWRVWKKDAADYEAEIAALEEKLAANQALMKQIMAKIVMAVMDIGIEIHPDQINSLLFSVTSDDDLELISVFDNVKTITGKLRDLTIASSENIETARRYYGMYTVLLKVLIQLQQHYIDKVNQEYLPSLVGIIEENQGLMDQTKRLLRESEGHYRQVYQANLNAQNLTDRTARMYKDFLLANQRRIQTSLKKSKKEYILAENTYQTVSTAYSLLAMIRQADLLFDALADLQIPELLSFENNEMRLEFEKLTNRMMAKTD